MNDKKQETIYWHDYETWGANPQKDFPCQFAGIRTDLDLNIISEPLMIFSQIANDCLPVPQACLVTGITPQRSLKEGLLERDFIAKILKEFSQPNTCVAGFNNIRFDDEITRYTLYRNFYDPYAREWQHGNSRWDIIDLARACYALRPEGINWPLNEAGLPSFKLQDLTKANDIQHQDAHDAMSDVYATIAVAKLIKERQPKLFDYLFSLRDKRKVLEQIDYQQLTPLVHISSKIPSVHGCCTWIVPIAMHPTNKNAVIVLNLALDPSPLFTLSADQIRQKLYTPNAMLGENEQRLPIKLIHINKCPVLAPAKTLSAENAERLGIDRQLCLQNLQKIKANLQSLEKLQQVYIQTEQRDPLDAEHALYSGGFFSSNDKELMKKVTHSDLQGLTELSLPFEDERLNTLLFRYRARNAPQSLSETEVERWQRYRHFKFYDNESPASIKMPEYLMQLEQLSSEYARNPEKLAVLKNLYNYAKGL
ncbi:exodeoxyribonuclease I [Paraglaciecola arctica]|uniref:Exodeoxyribonuclease I n=1 Tax=Paraglaciecola arctica BSs20135 TaxID=493475 RepID=K6YS02_9ALTE|nr:exodeoxyribonuclease I [Paraglaciecola arctica]GAC19458.1 exodeoxyribonuclease I [Paraglaciecola arctica BSs20135]